MQEIELKIGKPYRSSNDANAIVPESKIEFSATFADQYRALKFMHELNELVARYVAGKEVE